jgi:hypothetical protein
MIYSAKANPGDRSYFLANRNSFFHRFADSGFRTKWTGFWTQEKKWLEFFAFTVGGEWLSGSNMVGFRYDYSKAVHYYRTGRGLVKETVFVPEGSDVVIVALECERRFRIGLRLAANIRLLSENQTGRRYGVSRDRMMLEVRNSLGKMLVKCEGSRMSFEPQESYETHAPAGEPQSYFVPGRIALRGKRVLFSFGPGDFDLKGYGRALAAKARRAGLLVRGLIRSDNRELADGFGSAILGIDLLRKDSGFFAGLPWFQQCWGRDSLWSLPALVDLGYHQEARSTLDFFARNSDDMCVPNFVSGGMGKAFNSIDATLLWIIGLEHYVMNSGDLDFLKSMEMHMRDFLGFLHARESSGFLQHDFDRNETWMDTQRRYSCAVEIQSLYCRSLLSASLLFGLLGDKEKKRELERKAGEFSSNFDRRFFRSGFYADSIRHNGPVMRRTANSLVPLIFGPGKRHREVLETIRSDVFMCEKGIRTLASDEPDFSPGGYHNGSAWSLTTAWAAAAEFRHGDPDRGWDLMLRMIKDMGVDAVGCVGECWNSETSRLMGCSLQLWGCAFLVRLIDEFLLGIRADVPCNSITVTPRLPGSVRKVERVRFFGDRKLCLTFERKGTRVLVRCSDPDVKLIKA